MFYQGLNRHRLDKTPAVRVLNSFKNVSLKNCPEPRQTEVNHEAKGGEPRQTKVNQGKRR